MSFLQALKLFQTKVKATACSMHWPVLIVTSHPKIALIAMRAAIVSFSKRNSETLQAHWDQRMPSDQPTKEPFSKYLEALEKIGAWGGFLEICAYAKAQKYNVLVLDTDCGKAFEFHGGDDTSPYVVLRFASKHNYEWVKCDSGAIAELWLNAENPKLHGYRGAAKSTHSLHLSAFASSRRTVVKSSHFKKSRPASSLHLTDLI